MRVSFAVAMFVALALGTACDRSLPTTPTGQSREATTPTTAANAVVGTTAAGSALTLVDVTAGGTGTYNYVGQSVTIPGHAAYNRIRFNWYGYGATAGVPTAFGTLYLLDAAYSGPPIQLGASTQGFVAASESIVDGQYVFDSKVKIKGGTKYWFYTDRPGSLSMGFYDSTYPEGDMYITGMPTLNFHLAQASGAPGVYVDANFRLDVRTDR